MARGFSSCCPYNVVASGLQQPCITLGSFIVSTGLYEPHCRGFILSRRVTEGLHREAVSSETRFVRTSECVCKQLRVLILSYGGAHFALESGKIRACLGFAGRSSFPFARKTASHVALVAEEKASPGYIRGESWVEDLLSKYQACRIKAWHQLGSSHPHVRVSPRFPRLP